MKPASRGWATGLLVALVAGGVGYWVGRRPEPEPPTNETLVVPSPSVIVAVRELAHLEGAAFHVERVVDLKEKQSKFFGLIDTEDAILLIAAGDVVAGVDLREVREEDVRVDWARRSVRLRLPRATVLSSRIDNERTYVHTRSTATLATRRENLETRARQEAERSLRQAALDGGILRTAEDSVERTVEGLMRSLGFRHVEVGFTGDGGEERPSAIEAPRR